MYHMASRVVTVLGKKVFPAVDVVVFIIPTRSIIVCPKSIEEVYVGALSDIRGIKYDPPNRELPEGVPEVALIPPSLSPCVVCVSLSHLFP
jgi:hypothetical protein